ncbi:DUF2993 domain-containing protein [Nocardioides salsibiostraticola]
MRKLLGTLLVLLILVLAVDRGGDLIAEQASEASLQESQGLANRPEVSIGGFPFLTQVATREFDEIDVVATGIALDGGLTLNRLRVVLGDVVTSRDFESFQVARARATAVVGYDELGDLLGIDLAFDSDGEVRASRTFEVLGETVSPTITVRPEIVDGALGFGEPTVNSLGVAGAVVTETLNEIFGTTVPLQGIPFDITLDDVRVEPRGVVLVLSGANLEYVAPS